MKFNAAISCLTLLVVLSGNAYCATYTETRIFNGQNQFNDDSFERVIDTVGDVTTIDTGDILEGIVRITDIGLAAGTRYPVGLAGDPVEVTGYFRGIATVSGSTISLTPDPVFTAVYGTGALAALFEGPTANFTTGPTVAASIASATNGTFLGAVGFSGPGGTAVGGEGWASTVFTTSYLPSPAFQTDIGSYNAKLSFIDVTGSAGVGALAGFTFVPAQGSLFGTKAPTEFSISGQLFARASDSINVDVWPVGNTADIFFQVTGVIPEPASMLAWAGMSLFGVAAAARRRRKA